MRAWEIGRFGLEKLALVERPDPQPGPGQVVVRVRAASLNYRDLMTIQGTYNPKQKLPLIPGSDGAGEIVAVGPGVRRVRVGDRVCSVLAQHWVAGEPTRERVRSSLGGPFDGVLAELALLSEDGVVPAPAHLSDEEAATLPCAALTAWNALVTEGRVTAGDTVLVQGTGGVSLFALQIARLIGARVIVTSSSDDKLARALELGAAEGINYRTVPDWGGRAKELTGGRGVDHVIEVGGAGTLQQSLRALRFGGRISLIGVLAGGTAEIPLALIFMQKASVQGIIVGDRDSFEAMNRALELHQLHPVIDSTFAFDQVPAALERMASGRHFGKIVIEV
ncbi:MAG TPA: NAD(P)-dependent alcohol dehydrogenase [Thermoanaerobaculia bacterium]|nr:NAD(P)-dependent alcohol dehydrogenase [Thermoanaerobaculia bacterium]